MATWLIKFRHALKQESRTSTFRDGYLTVQTPNSKALSERDAADAVQRSLQERHDKGASDFEVRIHSVQPVNPDRPPD